MSCSVSTDKKPASSISDTLTLLTERDLIPEGTAYDPASNLLFITKSRQAKQTKQPKCLPPEANEINTLVR
ncbi:MAG: hypothetical protein EBU52_14840 [Cytophagia bacterium]|nr:hypothetical protein [Cytophagia bacterium]